MFENIEKINSSWKLNLDAVQYVGRFSSCDLNHSTAIATRVCSYVKYTAASCTIDSLRYFPTEDLIQETLYEFCVNLPSKREIFIHRLQNANPSPRTEIKLHMFGYIGKLDKYPEYVLDYETFFRRDASGEFFIRDKYV